MASMTTPKGTAMRRLLLALALAAAPAFAATPNDLLADFATQAKKESPAFAGFSAERGRAFFTAAHGKDWRCDTCHGPNPAQPGKHTVTGKTIAPLAPHRRRLTMVAPHREQPLRCLSTPPTHCSASGTASPTSVDHGPGPRTVPQERNDS